MCTTTALETTIIIKKKIKMGENATSLKPYCTLPITLNLQPLSTIKHKNRINFLCYVECPSGPL